MAIPPEGNHGSRIHQNNYPVQDDEYNYHDSLQVHLIGELAVENVTLRCQTQLRSARLISNEILSPIS